MTELTSFIVSSLVVGLSATIPPGTIFAMTVAESAENGSKAEYMVILGHALVEMLVVVMLYLGLGIFLSSGLVKVVVGLFGGVVLLWTGGNLLKDVYQRKVKYSMEEPGMVDSWYGVSDPVFRGVIASVANPYFLLWWATVGGSFILKGSSFLGWLAPLVFLLSHWVFDIPWFAFTSYTVDRGRVFLGGKGFMVLLGICGGSLAVLGLIYVREGLKLILESMQ